MLGLRTYSLTARRLFSTSSALSQGKTPKFSFLDKASHETSEPKEDVKLERNVIKSFGFGDLYDPFDFSIAKLRLDKQKAAANYTTKTFFDKKKVNPLDLYLNTRYLSEYLTSTGRIIPREVTKLSLKNQKKLAKAVKRARAAGLLSSVHKDVGHMFFTNEINHTKN